MIKNGHLLCAQYTNASNSTELTKIDKTIIAAYTFYENAVNVHDTAYTDAATFKLAMSGVMLVYELATPEITDISHLLPEDNLIGVEGCGSITAENEFGYDVPMAITYQVEETV